MAKRALSDRVYGWLLRLLPPEFRGDFGDDMAADFVEQREDARPRGSFAVARLWWRTTPQLLALVARTWLADLGQDARFALRMMGRSPGFTAAAVLMLAVGTGANAAVFSVLDALWLHQKFPHEDRLVLVLEQPPERRSPGAAVPLPHIALFQGESFIDGIGHNGGGLPQPVLTGLGDPHRLNLECVSDGMFSMLETPALAGRTLNAADGHIGSEPVIVLSYSAWQRELNGRRDALGIAMTLDDVPTTVVGIMPRGYFGALGRSGIDGWLPTYSRNCSLQPTGNVNAVARLHPGVSIATAESMLNALPDLVRPTASGTPSARVALISLDEQTYSDVRTGYLMLIGAVACVLVIACANVANLQLERVVGRRQETAIRLALGASRGRIVRQTLTENLLLALLGAAAGLATAWWTLGGIIALLPRYNGNPGDIVVSGRVLAFSLTLACAAGAAVGLFPAIQATRLSVANDLRDGARTSTLGGAWTRRGLVVVELALSVVLIIGATLMLRTFVALRPSHPGFDPSHKAVGLVRLPPTPHPGQDGHLFFDALFERLHSMPGVQTAVGTSYVPMSGTVSTRTTTIDGKESTVFWASVTDNFFHDLGIAVTHGRSFDATDTGSAPLVAVVNEHAAKVLWNTDDPVGRSLTLKAYDGTVTTSQVVGTIADMRSQGPSLRAYSEVYTPFAQQPVASLNVIASTASGSVDDAVRAIQDAVHAVRPQQVVDRLRSFQLDTEETVGHQRFNMWLIGVLAAIAVGLAALGLAAVIGSWVTQRTRELGVLMALGASQGQVVRLLVWQGVTLAVVGIVLGVGAAFFATRLLTDLLYGVKPVDLATFAEAALIMLAITVAAAYVPARRAAKIDPIAALRAQ